MGSIFNRGFSKKHGSNLILLSLFLIGVVVWFLPIPAGMTKGVWQLHIIYLITIIGITLTPIPMEAIAILSIGACVATGTLTIEQSLSGFGDSIVWLIMFALFISVGFVKTGLGKRISYYLISKFGGSSLGLAYGLVFSEFFLSPFTPSAVARGGGIIFPIANSLAQSYAEKTNRETTSRVGGFFMQTCFHSNYITSSLFLTAMAANPFIVKLAEGFGVKISWLDWTSMAIVPGIITLLLMPLLLYYIYPPDIKHSEHAAKTAKNNLAELGPISSKEKSVLLVFLFLMLFWIFGSKLGITVITSTILGFCALLILGVVTIEDCINDKKTWEMFVWFSVLIMMSSILAKTGATFWSNKLQTLFYGINPTIATVLLGLVYFYSHYLFVSMTTHIVVAYPIFLTLFISIGVPPKIAALALGFMSILSGGLTHYGSTVAPIYFRTGYMSVKRWWYLCGIVSLLIIAVWGVVGGVWWKILGLW